jgi:hypothetical protein
MWKNLLIINASLMAFRPIKNKSFFSQEREKVGGEKGGERRLWECGKPEGFSIISTAGARGERGR